MAANNCSFMEDNRNYTPYALVVDDDPLILMDASDILIDAGFQPLDAGDVEAAERILVRYGEEITLLFTDVQMPGDRDGFELARLTADRWPAIEIMVASGAARPKPGDLPPNAVFIQKPFSASTVYEHLQVLLPDGRKPEPLKQRIRQT